MDSLLIVKEGSDQSDCDGPLYVLRSFDAVSRYFEPWYEMEPHICISEEGMFFRLVHDKDSNTIVLQRDARRPSDKKMFIRLLRRYLDSVTHSQNATSRDAAIRAVALLEKKTPNSLVTIHDMADELGFE